MKSKQEVPVFIGNIMSKIPTIGANDPSIILMGTVVSCPTQVAAEGQGRFISITSYFIQENVSRPCTKSSTAICRLSSSVAKLTTNYISSCLVPAMVTHCSPQTLILNFYSSTHTRLTTHEPNSWRKSSELSKQLKWNMTPHCVGRNRLWQAFPLFYFWCHLLWQKLASSILKFLRRKRSLRWYLDQNDWVNGAWNNSMLGREISFDYILATLQISWLDNAFLIMC